MSTLHRKATGGRISLGVGLGGFADGGLPHQILQWHHMLSLVMPPRDMEAVAVNMRWDGYFRAFVWCVTIGGERYGVPDAVSMHCRPLLGLGAFF